MSPRRMLATAASLALLLLLLPATALADDYSDPDYRAHDVDNYARARGTQLHQATSPDYHLAFVGAGAHSVTQAWSNQAEDARHGRVYGGVSQFVPTWGVGNAERYHDVGYRRVAFLARTGAKLQGHLWGSEAPGPRPGVVITTGSIQGSNQMYWWAAQALAAAGYVVLTYDVQGQGQSETFGHDPGSPVPTTENVPFQQDANFYDGTIDALRFFLSTPDAPYVPVGWDEEDLAAARAAADGERMDWSNPGYAALDGERIGIAGHSLGARAVSHVQQCSDEGETYRTAEVCHGEAYPIRAVVAWDALDASVTPVVPAMDQRADGYFLWPTATPAAPDPEESLPAFRHWRDAGLDAMTVTVRGGTHLEWSQMAYHGAATRYGNDLAAYYTVAWMERWLPHAQQRRAAGLQALLGGPTADAALPWSANHLSVRRYSAMALHQPGAERAPRFAHESTDLRAWAGRSEVGDWAGANQDRAGSELPD